MQNCINNLSDKVSEITKIQLRIFLNSVLNKLSSNKVLKKQLGLQNYNPTYLNINDNYTYTIKLYIEYVNKTLFKAFEEVKQSINNKTNAEEIIDLRTKYCVRIISAKDYIKISKKYTFIDIKNSEKHYEKNSCIVFHKSKHIAIGKYNLEINIIENLSFEDVLICMNRDWKYDEKHIIKGAANIEDEITL